MGTAAKYLTFRVAGREFAMDAARVRAIIPFSEFLPMAGNDPAVIGVASLRGQMVTVTDLRVKLNLPQPSAGREPRIVVVDVNAALAAFIADRVSSVVEYHERELHNGTFRGHGRPRRLLDAGALLSSSVPSSL